MKNTIDFGLFDFHISHIAAVEKCTVEDACCKAVQCGCSKVECGFDAISEEKIRIYHDNGLKVSSIYCFLNFEQDVESRLAALLDIAEKASPCFVMPIPEKDNTPELRQKIIPRLIRLQKELSDRKIIMVMEDYDGPDKSFATSTGLLAYLDVIPGLKCCFDTGNFFYNGEDVLQVFPLFADRIVHCHFKDRRLDETYAKFIGETASGVRTAYSEIGKGFLPVKEIFYALLELGYKGSVIAEFAMCHDPLGTLRNSIAAMKQWQE